MTPAFRPRWKPNNAATGPKLDLAATAAFRVIFRQALRRGRVSTLAFGAGMFLFQFITVITYPAIGGEANTRAVFEALGPEMQRLLKLVPNLQAGFGPANYLAFGYFHPVFLGLGSAYVVSRASDAVAGDIERGTILYILSRPVSRRALLLGKAAEVACGLTIVVGLSALGTACGLVLTPLSPAISLWPFVVIALNAYALFLALGGVALLISAGSSSPARVAGWGTAFALLAFVADFLAVLPVIGWLAVVSPFRYYDPQSIIGSGGRLPLPGMVFLLAVASLASTLALLIFEKRDIAA